MYKQHECPRCGGTIPNASAPGAYPGALSRIDNKTEICSDCGTQEGFESMYGTLLPMDVWWAARNFLRDEVEMTRAQARYPSITT